MLSFGTDSCKGTSSDTAIHGIQSTVLLRKKRGSGRSLGSSSGLASNAGSLPTANV